MKPQHYGKESLRAMLQDADVIDGLREKHAAGGDAHFESVDPAAATPLLRADRGTEAVRAGPFDHMEAIVLTEGRPALLIQAGTYQEPELSVLRDRLAPHRAAIDGAIASVARLELLNHSSLRYAGTAWMIDEDVMITNRHVANLFAYSFGGRFVFRNNPAGKPFRTQVDFLEEHEREDVFEVPIVQILHIEDDSPFAPDMALVRVEPADGLPAPIRLSAEALAPQEDVVVIGYPARDLRNPPTIMDDLFGGVYEVKRLSPGRVSGVSTDSFVFSHDCTTLGGNSGSVVIRPSTGEAVGLHFSGSFMENNFAVSGAQISERLGRLGDRFLAPASAIAPGPPVAAPVDDVEAPTAEELLGRGGYAPGFLGADVPLPEVTDLTDGSVDAADIALTELKYTHFSVCMQPLYKFAAYTACNVDGARWFRIPRERDRWYYDPRVARETQAGNDLYRNNRLQRGHLVRRVDPAWGEHRGEAEQAIRDTFFWTNCTPQHERFNPRSWLDLERYVLDNALAHELKISVFTGPVFRDSDKVYRGYRIPEDYWKVLAMVRADTGQLSVTAYLLSQSEFMDHLEFVYGEFETYQVPLAKILALTGLDFSHLSRFDPLSRIESVPFVEIRSGADLVL